ncbi:hypothetical protein CR513_04123, partial [Mucuna pruriens]
MRGGIINWVPVSVEKPNGISLHGKSILISMPAVVSMCSVLYVKNGMSKTGLSECRICWLWFCHAAAQMSFISDFVGQKSPANNATPVYSKILANWDTDMYSTFPSQIHDDKDRMFCKEHGIYRNNIVRKTPQQNGLAEEMNIEPCWKGLRWSQKLEDNLYTAPGETTVRVYSLATYRDRRIIKPLQRFGYVDMTAYALNSADMVNNEEHRTNKEALDNKDCDRWRLAIKIRYENWSRSQRKLNW